MENPSTDFCGYSVPHPYVPKMNVRLQTKQSGETHPTALQVLDSGFDDIIKICDILDNKFEESLRKYNNKQL